MSGNGGAINNSGSLTVTNCVFFNNAVNGDGGAIYNAAGTNAYVGGSTFGVLQNGYTSLVTDEYPKFDANYGTSSSSQGGAIYNAGTMTVDNSSLLGNFMTDSSGSGDARHRQRQYRHHDHRQFHDRRWHGGGQHERGLRVQRRRRRLQRRPDDPEHFHAVRQPRLLHGQPIHGEGSGVFNDASGNLTVSNSTIANNNGGIANLAGGSVLLMNSIVFGNLHVIGSIKETDLDGSFSGSNNLIGDIVIDTAGNATGIADGTNGNQVGALRRQPELYTQPQPVPAADRLLRWHHADHAGHQCLQQPEPCRYQSGNIHISRWAV